MCSRVLIVLIISAFLTPLPVFATEPAPENVRELLRNRIEFQTETMGAVFVLGKELYSKVILPGFYTETGFHPMWLTRDLNQAIRLREAIRESYYHGLNPANYHLAEIDRLMPASPETTSLAGFSAGKVVDLELLLTDAFLMLASHHLTGQLDHESLSPTWQIQREATDFKVLLHRVKAGDNPHEVINGLLPKHKEYHMLRQALEKYRQVSANGGWPMLEGGPTLRMGMTDPRVATLRKRLILAGDHPETDSESHEFDETLHRAVIQFQYRHGLDRDGAVGPRTINSLNVPVENRLMTTLVNLERWRLLRQDLGRRHIRVNIADFRVLVVEDDEVVMNLRAIVGRDYRKTPVFSSRMTYLVLSPFWHIPPGISAKDILPRMRQNPGYAKEQNIRIFDGWGSEAKEIDPMSVDWAAVRPNRYRFRQDPGPNNALGDVKFMFPNPYHVYIHDTPNRDLFNRSVRDFSSGCIRVERPLELAEYLLQNNPGWDRNAIDAAVRNRVERTVRFTEPLWVHIYYWTAWTDTDGLVHFRHDIYNHDANLIQTLLNEVNTPLISFEPSR